MLGAAIVLRAPVVDVTQSITQAEMEVEGQLVFKVYHSPGLEFALAVVDGVGTVGETVREAERRFHRKFIAVVLRPKTKGYRVHEQLFGACIGERTRHIEVLPANGALSGVITEDETARIVERLEKVEIGTRVPSTRDVDRLRRGHARGAVERGELRRFVGRGGKNDARIELVAFRLFAAVLFKSIFACQCEVVRDLVLQIRVAEVYILRIGEVG